MSELHAVMIPESFLLYGGLITVEILGGLVYWKKGSQQIGEEKIILRYFSFFFFLIAVSELFFYASIFHMPGGQFIELTYFARMGWEEPSQAFAIVKSISYFSQSCAFLTPLAAYERLQQRRPWAASLVIVALVPFTILPPLPIVRAIHLYGMTVVGLIAVLSAMYNFTERSRPEFRPTTSLIIFGIFMLMTGVGVGSSEVARLDIPLLLIIGPGCRVVGCILSLLPFALDFTSPKRARKIFIATGGLPLGISLAMTTFMFLMVDSLGWRATYVVFNVVILVMVLLLRPLAAEYWNPARTTAKSRAAQEGGGALGAFRKEEAVAGEIDDLLGAYREWEGDRAGKKAGDPPGEGQ